MTREEEQGKVLAKISNLWPSFKAQVTDVGGAKQYKYADLHVIWLRSIEGWLKDYSAETLCFVAEQVVKYDERFSPAFSGSIGKFNSYIREYGQRRDGYTPVVNTDQIEREAGESIVAQWTQTLPVDWPELYDLIYKVRDLLDQRCGYGREVIEQRLIKLFGRQDYFQFLYEQCTSSMDFIDRVRRRSDTTYSKMDESYGRFVEDRRRAKEELEKLGVHGLAA